MENESAYPELAVVIAGNISALREGRGWSYGQAARHYGEAGLPASKSWAASIEGTTTTADDGSTVTRYRDLSIDHLLGLAKVYGEPVMGLCLPPPGEQVVVGHERLDELEVTVRIMGDRPWVEQTLAEVDSRLLSSAFKDWPLFDIALGGAVELSLADVGAPQSLEDFASAAEHMAEVVRRASAHMKDRSNAALHRLVEPHRRDY